MPSECSLNRPVPRWLHIWAILTVIATALLLALGGLVTTFRVGMADPIWPTTPWFLFFTSWSEPRPGFLIEHSHRLAGYVVGCFTIVLTVGMLATARTCGLKKLWYSLFVCGYRTGNAGGISSGSQRVDGTESRYHSRLLCPNRFQPPRGSCGTYGDAGRRIQSASG